MLPKGDFLVVWEEILGRNGAYIVFLKKKLCTTKDFWIHGHGWWTIISLQIMCKSTPPTSPVSSSPTSSIYVSSISPPSPPPIVNTSIKPYIKGFNWAKSMVFVGDANFNHLN